MENKNITNALNPIGTEIGKHLNKDTEIITKKCNMCGNFWRHIPRFDELVGNAVDDSELLCGGAVWQPYA